MSFNIADFSAKINGTGLAKNNLFAVGITPPRSMNLPIKEDLPFLCKNASIPGMDVESVGFKPEGWGTEVTAPTGFTKNNLTLTFMIDSNFAVKQFFHRWFQTIVNYNELGGEFSADPSGKLPYQFDYKENYIGTIDIEVYSELDKSRSYIYKFGKAFPVSIGSIESSWENQAEIMIMTVSFAYESMGVSGMSESSAVSDNIFNGSASGDLFGGGALSGGISNAGQSFVDQFLAPVNNVVSSINNIRNTGNDFVSSLRNIF